MVKCLIDGTEHYGIKELHAHLRKLKMAQKEYYERYIAKKDLLTGELIEFKDYKSYEISDFKNKINLNKYCNQFPEKGIEWGKRYLARRKEEKGLIWAPSHVELRSLHCPNVRYFEKFSDYAKVCGELKLKVKFNYKEKLKFTALASKVSVIKDTREQRPLEVKNSYVDTLNFGDYTITSQNPANLYVERKSLNDFVGTAGKDIERFRRELGRARDAGAYMVVLVEKNINDSLHFDHQFETRYAKVSPDHIFKNMRDLLGEFEDLQFLFVDGRKESERILIKLFELGNQVKTTDLQFRYEMGEL
jgi:hypothetical protein